MRLYGVFMNIKDTVKFNKSIYFIDTDGNLYIHYWNFEKKQAEYELKFISNSATNSHQPGKITALYADDRNLYGLGDNGCIFKYIEGKYNCSPVNWILDKSSEFRDSKNIFIKQMISKDLVLGSDINVYEWTWVDGRYGWQMMGKPTSYLVSSIM